MQNFVNVVVGVGKEGCEIGMGICRVGRFVKVGKKNYVGYLAI